MSSIRFSIVITCHNQSEFILDAVDSALVQRDPLKEIIVVDDGSTDESAEALKRYGKSIQIVTFAKNRGKSEARNVGAGRAQGEYLVFLDGDDLLMPWALSVYGRMVAERHPSFVLGRMHYFAGKVPVTSSQEVPSKIEFVEYGSFMNKDRSANLSASCFVIHRQAFQDVGGWSSDVFYNDTTDMGAKLGCSGHAILLRLPYTVFYRWHQSNSVRNLQIFLPATHYLLRKEKAEKYPGGRGLRFARNAYFGGITVYWIKRALRERYYRDAVKLAASGSPMILAAIAKRSIAWIGGRRPVETLDFSFEPDQA